MFSKINLLENKQPNKYYFSVTLGGYICVIYGTSLTSKNIFGHTFGNYLLGPSHIHPRDPCSKHPFRRMQQILVLGAWGGKGALWVEGTEGQGTEVSGRGHIVGTLQNSHERRARREKEAIFWRGLSIPPRLSGTSLRTKNSKLGRISW